MLVPLPVDLFPVVSVLLNAMTLKMRPKRYKLNVKNLDVAATFLRGGSVYPQGASVSLTLLQIQTNLPSVSTRVSVVLIYSWL